MRTRLLYPGVGIALFVAFLGKFAPACVTAKSAPSYSAITLNAGTSPSAAKIGDLDGDGRDDIAVVNVQGSLQLFFNGGAGAFQQVSLNNLWPSSSHTLNVAIGDLNGDGKNDLAVAPSTARGTVSVLLNQGNRVFSSLVNYDVCNTSNSVAIADLDLDGDNDLADIGSCSQAGILRNNGQGAFTSAGKFGSGNTSRSIALADFNGGGFADIAYLNATVKGQVTVLFNKRDGTFGSAMSLYAGDLPADLTAGDFDGEGSQDIAIANPYLSQIIVLLNDRAGTFPGYSKLSAGDVPTSIAGGVFNGDGRLDIAAASVGNNAGAIILNQGNYNLGNPTMLQVGENPVDLTAGRLDGDALPDLVAVNQTSGTITVLLSSRGSDPPPPSPAQMTLTASTRKTFAASLVDLKWNGAASSKLDLYRDGSRIATISNTGTYTDRLNSRTRGVFNYRICLSGSGTCSNQAVISF